MQQLARTSIDLMHQLFHLFWHQNCFSSDPQYDPCPIAKAVLDINKFWWQQILGHQKWQIQHHQSYESGLY